MHDSYYKLDIYQYSKTYTGAQQYRALTMILQSLKTQTMISEMPSLRYITCAYQILSPLQSLYFSLLIHRIFNLLVIYKMPIVVQSPVLCTSRPIHKQCVNRHIRLFQYHYCITFYSQNTVIQVCHHNVDHKVNTHMHLVYHNRP